MKLNGVKNLIVSLALSIMMYLCVGLMFAQGFVLVDFLKGGVINQQFEIKRFFVTENPDQHIADCIFQKYLEEDYEGIRELGAQYNFTYYIHYESGGAILRTMNYKNVNTSTAYTYNVCEHEDTEASSGSQDGATDDQTTAVSEEDNSSDKNLRREGTGKHKGDYNIVIRVALPRIEIEKSEVNQILVWDFFYSRPWLEIILLLVLFSLFVISTYLMLLYASPMYKICLALVSITLAEVVFLYQRMTDPVTYRTVIPMLVLEKLFFILVSAIYLYHFRSLREQIQELSSQEKTADHKYWYPISLKPFEEDIKEAKNSIELAVNERMKSERMKTELISNVSHDIKTPLTSIINFSDLIQKEKTENAIITEYAEHLHKQSIRMKELLDSLIEASKASVGAVEIHMVPCNVQTLLEQCVVEYEEKLKAQEITLVDVPLEEGKNEELRINADVKALSRVFDNLLTNICKYGMPGSRAYVDVVESEEQVVISFRNVTKEAIHVKADELTERFVRGDVSRHSEGHGLGLSIVKSLMDLMEGELELSANYDMFEAKLIFKKVPAEDEKVKVNV